MSEDSDRDARRRAEELARAFLARVWGGAASELDAIDELMTAVRRAMHVDADRA